MTRGSSIEEGEGRKRFITISEEGGGKEKDSR